MKKIQKKLLTQRTDSHKNVSIQFLDTHTCWFPNLSKQPFGNDNDEDEGHHQQIAPQCWPRALFFFYFQSPFIGHSTPSNYITRSAIRRLRPKQRSGIFLIRVAKRPIRTCSRGIFVFALMAPWWPEYLTVNGMTGSKRNVELKGRTPSMSVRLKFKVSRERFREEAITICKWLSRGSL